MSYIDPTGNFSIGSTMSAINSMANLALRAYNTYDNVTTLIDIAKGDVTLTELALTYAISEIEIGDKVWTYNTETGEKSLQYVIHLIEGSGEKELVDVELITGEIIESTSNHPFYLPNTKTWVETADLFSGEFLFGLDGREYSVNNVSMRLENATVYNLSVASNHNYFVGDTGVLAHNCYQKLGKREYLPLMASRGKPLSFLKRLVLIMEKTVRWLRLEYSDGGDVIHGHPISLEQYRKLLK